MCSAITIVMKNIISAVDGLLQQVSDNLRDLRTISNVIEGVPAALQSEQLLPEAKINALEKTRPN